PGCQVIEKPMADGGEGTAQAVMAGMGGPWMPVSVMGPLQEMSVPAGFVWMDWQKLALVEMAAASGLLLLAAGQRNPLKTTTYGTGQLLRAAVEQGARKIWLAVGGSSTVDGGVGAAAALGWKFLDRSGRPVGLGGEALSRIDDIVPPAEGFPACEVLSDVTNPFCGPNGAARIFGPQKGATPEMVELLDNGLDHLSRVIEKKLGVHLKDLSGAGAAGGLAGGAVAFFGATLVSGIERIMSLLNLDEALQNADWVITGEGSFDNQSLQGKVVSGIIRKAKEKGVRVAVIAGRVSLEESLWRQAGVDRVMPLQDGSLTTAYCMTHAEELLDQRIRSL
ncbi:MAG: glycerate kinase, partial [Lentisphaerota bacterium]